MINHLRSHHLIGRFRECRCFEHKAGISGGFLNLSRLLKPGEQLMRGELTS